MKRPTLWKLSVGLVATASLWTLLSAGKAWEEKPFLEWSRDEALRVLNESPWAQQVVFRELSAAAAPGPAAPNTQPSEGSRSFPPPQRSSASSGVQTRTTAVYTIGFLSARPLRMALARLAMINSGLDESRARQFAGENPFPDQVAISVVAPGEQRDSIMMTLGTADLRDSTYLELKKSKRRIALERYLKPGEEGNDQAIFFFRRLDQGKDLLTLAEDEVKFYARLSPSLVLEKKFKLKKMVFDGQLEI